MCRLVEGDLYPGLHLLCGFERGLDCVAGNMAGVKTVERRSNQQAEQDKLGWLGFGQQLSHGLFLARKY